MSFLVDGNNLIGHSKDLSLGDPKSRDELVRRLNRFAHARKAKVCVVFDGAPPAHHAGQASIWDRVEILFVGAGKDADSEIRRQIAPMKNRQEWIVVSSDHAVYGFARSCGVAAMKCHELNQLLSGNPTKPLKRAPHSSERVSRKGVEEWLKIFGEK